MRQGCVLSPILFTFYSEFLINKASNEVDGVKINGICIKSIRYANGMAVVATSNGELQRMMDRIQKKCIEYGMSLNTKKTMAMKIGSNAKDQARTYRGCGRVKHPRAQFLSAQDQIWHFCRQISKFVIYVGKMQSFRIYRQKAMLPYN